MPGGAAAFSPFTFRLTHAGRSYGPCTRQATPATCGQAVKVPLIVV
jgi:hypothetical protein